MTTASSFIYSWYTEDDEVGEEPRFVIRGFGLTETGKNVMIEISDFPVYLYVELPSHVSWKTSRMLLSHVQEKLLEMFNRFSVEPLKMALLYKKKLYFYSEEEYPFLFVAFKTQNDRLTIARFLTKNDVLTIYGKRYRVRCHEQDASGLLQFICFKNISSIGWVNVKNVIQNEDHNTYCDEVWECSYKDIFPGDSEVIPKFNIFAFDLEVYSSDHSKMPDARLKKDEIFQISIIGESQKLLLTLGTVDKTKFTQQNIQVIQYKNEKALLIGFAECVIRLRAHVLIGYNIFGFDIPYMMDRAKLHGIYNQFAAHGMIKNRICNEKKISWTSSAYKNQDFRFIDVIGRIVVDLLPQIKRDYKLSNYKLSTVAQHFLNADKDPVKPKDIFEFYDRFLQGCDELSIQLLTTIGEYCVKDSQLVLDLFQKLQLWIGLMEMAKICNVAVPCLYTQGQQIKVYSQIYKHCLYQKTVVESSQYHANINSNSKYTGAFVFDPSPGIYNDIIPFDFASLYPTTIIAYNIDFSTLVTDPNVPDDKCHVIQWNEHDGKSYKFRFIKSQKGVIPRMLEDLLNKRKQTKLQMKNYDKNSLMNTVLDKRQLSLKVSANSAYGIMGAIKGYLPFLPGAMSTTAMGRQSIMRAAKHVQEKYGGELIYGDSVCSYTPVMIRISKRKIYIVEIENLPNVLGHFLYWKTADNNKQFMELNHMCVETWSETGWTRIFRIIRHEFKKDSQCIYRVISPEGDLVDVTNDHSLLLKNGDIIKPTDPLINTAALLTNEFPEMNDCNDMTKTELDAYMFALCGTCTIPDWILYSSNIELISAYWRGFCKMHGVINPSDGLTQLCLESQLLCQMAFIIMNKLNLKPGKIECGYRCYFIKVIERSSQINHNHNILQPIAYNGYVYDLTTENNHFAAGIGHLIVHNTDSIYCHFPEIPNKELWDFAVKVENEFTSLFPSPMKLAFEEKIYKRFLILTKKRYMAFTQNADLSIDQLLTIRGVLLARRDNCKWIRSIYEKTVRTLMDLNNPLPKISAIEYIIQEEMIKLCSHYYDSSYITITKTVGSEYKKKTIIGYDESTGKITDLSKFKKRLQELDISMTDPKWLELYQKRMIPAHVQLANKMSDRGCPVAAGTRIEYVMLRHENTKAKQFQKIEDPEYQKEYSDVLPLDFLFILNLVKNSLQQLISVVFKNDHLIDDLIALHATKQNMMDEIKHLHEPKLVFVEK